MKELSMFQLCKESDGYFIYYNYENKKLYGCYNFEEDLKPNYNILLVQPFIIFAAEFLNKWIGQRSTEVRYFVCTFCIFLATVSINIFFKTLVRSTDEIRNRRLQELPEPSKKEWAKYLKQAEKQLKKQIYLYVWLGLGMAVSIALFLWNGFIFFLLIYIVLYLVLRPFIMVGCPIRKYKLIKAGRNHDII